MGLDSHNLSTAIVLVAETVITSLCTTVVRFAVTVIAFVYRAGTRIGRSIHFRCRSKVLK